MDSINIFLDERDEEEGEGDDDDDGRVRILELLLVPVGGASASARSLMGSRTAAAAATMLRMDLIFDCVGLKIWRSNGLSMEERAMWKVHGGFRRFQRKPHEMRDGVWKKRGTVFCVFACHASANLLHSQ